MDNSIEKKLIKLAVNGDTMAFEKLLSANLKLIYNICYSLLGNEEDSKDATQDASIKIFKGIKNFREDSKFSTWIYRIAVNSSKDLISKNYKDAPLSLDAEIELSGESIISAKSKEQDDPERLALRREKLNTIKKAISNLPFEAKELIVLRDLNGLSYEEISEITGKNTGTVKSTLHRSRKLLAKDLISMGIVPSGVQRR